MFSQSFLQMNTIFISILIEAIPFVLIGVLVSGIIQIFLTEEMIKKLLPKNRFLSILFAILLGALFPACECGIVPIVRRLILKGVPLHAAIVFMLTAPIINPIVLFSTYIAFGNQWNMMLLRGGVAALVAMLIGTIISYQFKGDQLIEKAKAHSHHHHHSSSKNSLSSKLASVFRHAIEEFFSVGKYLIFGAFIAAAMQTFIKTSALLEIGHSKASSSLVMMALSFLLSLCSQADAFIASSFQSTFSKGSLIAFLVFGAMLDVKNTLMMLSVFKKRFVFYVIGYIIIFVFLSSLYI
ncbi:permease [Bacillus sp. S/N-304-OC-R1]|uniref:permease n=1 Tax=Bacillus sp. S/N-304-OC-R1 TaxID=2758034 RepID=UPI001C8E1AF4|nr:permease [Bacillus sp. S/N-304-OC-R1]MBY0122749.1 permease [Bacillus sp. S/N-304-OC-R1]